MTRVHIGEAERVRRKHNGRRVSPTPAASQAVRSFDEFVCPFVRTPCLADGRVIRHFRVVKYPPVSCCRGANA